MANGFCFFSAGKGIKSLYIPAHVGSASRSLLYVYKYTLLLYIRIFKRIFNQLQIVYICCTRGDFQYNKHSYYLFNKRARAINKSAVYIGSILLMRIAQVQSRILFFPKKLFAFLIYRISLVALAAGIDDPLSLAHENGDARTQSNEPEGNRLHGCLYTESKRETRGEASPRSNIARARLKRSAQNCEREISSLVVAKGVTRCFTVK